MSVKWKAKALVQKTISYFPYKEKMNYLLQKYVTKGLELNDIHFGYKLQAAADHISYLNKYSQNASLCNISVLEIGTGWYPVVPISLYLYGVKSITSIDIREWMSEKSILTCIQKFIQWNDAGKLQEYLPDIQNEKWIQLTEMLNQTDSFSKDEFNLLIGMKTLVCDARNTGLQSGCFDFICSNNTFEHIYPDVLKDILKEFIRLLKVGGLMSHQIDMSDHFAHFDKKITVFNFLRYSARKWKCIDNKIQPQNRLRFVSYKQIYANLSIPVTEEKTWSGQPEDLNLISVSDEFNSFTSEELLITHAHIVSKF